MTLIKTAPPLWHYLADAFNHDFINQKLMDYKMDTPAMNVIENSDNYHIELAAPGYKKDDFKVIIEEGMIFIEASTSQSDEEKSKNYTRKEFHSQSFTKRFEMPKNVNDSQIEAKYEEGVLNIILAKNLSVPIEKKQITIE